ncbi:MAG: lipoprotein-releasing ABC transporter permease subunit [Magnetococcales bacterium]|nr:lipoprotein-releasing ABC transporter permease subunit [Magnetococcales bacterium]
MLSSRYEWFIGLRYLRAKRNQSFISIITFFSLGGIALGVAALIVVLAVMTGFRQELQSQILGITGHATVRSYSSYVNNYPWLLKEVNKNNGVVAASPFISGQAMLTGQRRRPYGVSLRGIIPALDSQVSALDKNIKIGSINNLGKYRIILGQRLANNLGVGFGDKVTVMVAAGNVTAMGTLPRLKRFVVGGIFESGMYEYDNTLAYIHLKDAQTLLRIGSDVVTGVEIMTPQAEQAFAVRKELQKSLGNAYWVRDWMQMNQNFFRALKMEKATMFVILFLVVIVAAFNIISSLVMVVMEKGREIAILKSMGATPGGILTIFLVNGGVIGFVGTLSGLALGLALAFNLEAALGFIEDMFGIQILSGEVYYIDHLPSVVLWSDVAWIAGISLVITLLAALYPAWRASGVDPVDGLRYE